MIKEGLLCAIVLVRSFMPDVLWAQSCESLSKLVSPRASITLANRIDSGIFTPPASSTALSRLPAARASNFLYLVSPTSALIGFFWLGEVPTPLGILGGALALGGVIVVNLKR